MRAFVPRGYEVQVLAAPGSRNPFSCAVGFGLPRLGFSCKIVPGDSVVTGELLPVRYAVLSWATQSIWVSNSHQAAFLSAFLAGTEKPGDARAAADLPARIVDSPMGCRSDNFRQGAENPYLAVGIRVPVFLWDGGIWNWFDAGTVLRVFDALERRSVPGTLFFISGRNEATRDYDGPLERARNLVQELSLSAERVVFNPGRVGPDGLAPWLERYAAGVMGNKPTLQSRPCESHETRMDNGGTGSSLGL